jgi:hypothetical protein
MILGSIENNWDWSDRHEDSETITTGSIGEDDLGITGDVISSDKRSSVAEETTESALKGLTLPKGPTHRQEAMLVSRS